MELKATLFEVVDGVAVITLNRPHRLNAWTGRMHQEYLFSLCEADENPDVKAIVVTGAGRAFCAGGDAAALSGHAERGAYDSGTGQGLRTPKSDVDPAFRSGFACHWSLGKPVIAAINGAAAGVGLALACYADLRFAASGAKLTAAHGKLNLPAEFGLSWLLPRMIGVPRAMELLLTSRVFLAEEAQQMGLLNQVFPEAQLLAKTHAWVQKLIREVSPNSLRQTRWQVYKDLHRDIAASNRESEELLNEMVAEPDFDEGVRAFLEKREPRFGQPNRHT